MARFNRFPSRNRDLPQLEAYGGAAASGGTSSDFEHIITAVPDLTVGAVSGSVGDLASNAMSIRKMVLVFESTITGSDTHYCTLYLRQYRGGSIVATTTATTAVTSGLTTITPASMAGIFVGQYLDISGGTGTAETVIVQSVSSTTFSAVFANSHSGTYNIAQSALASVAFKNGTNASAYTATTYNIPRSTNIILGGDVITIQRVSNDSTGLATPAFKAIIDWAPSGAL